MDKDLKKGKLNYLQAYNRFLMDDNWHFSNSNIELCAKVVNIEKKRRMFIKDISIDMLDMPSTYSLNCEGELMSLISKKIEKSSFKIQQVDSKVLGEDWRRVGDELNGALRKADLQYAR